MELESLQQHIRTLATLPETDAPVISCYLELNKGRLKDRNAFDQQVRSLQLGLVGASRQDFADAVQRIETYLANELLPDATGLAVFSRAGDSPFFLPLQFHVAVPNWVAADSTPNIYSATSCRFASIKPFQSERNCSSNEFRSMRRPLFSSK